MATDFSRRVFQQQHGPRGAAADTAAKLQVALAHHQRGQLAQAEALYREVLAFAPMNFDVLHLLGVVQYQKGQHGAAVEFVQRAIAANPNQASAHSNLGLALQGLGRPVEALASYDRALALQPDYPEAVLNRGNALRELNRPAEALTSYDRALVLRPNDVAALNNRGNALLDLKRPGEALASYDQALALQPDYADATLNRGNALRALKRPEEALTSYDCALALKPDDATGLNNRGNALLDLKRPEEALACYDRALASKADYVDAMLNRGNALRALKRPDEALACYDRALALKPDSAEALLNRANALQELKRHCEALASYDRALAIRIDYGSAHHNEGLCRLLLGDFATGWQKYEWRWRDEQLEGARRDFAQPLWLGETDIVGKTVVLHAEQGLGDTIQFCRYAKWVAARGARVVMEVPPALLSLMAQVEGVDHLVGRGEPLPEFEYHCPMLSLPLAFNTRLDSIPSQVPYLHSEPERVGPWRHRLGAKSVPRVGLAWSGRATHLNDSNRSIPLRDLARLVFPDAQFVSLQKEVRAADEPALHERQDIRYFADELGDFADTSALIELMDVVVTVDTAVAHLAGAMGKEVWILLPFNPDWRWMLDRDDSPWYPTARLFRQRAHGDWSEVVERLAIELHERLLPRR